MTLEKKIEQILKDELRPENIKTIIDMAEFLKFKETQDKWNEINEQEHEYITEEERLQLEKIKLKGEFIDQDDILKELKVNKNEI
ncbi:MULTISPECIES: hypothetical protein [Tissierellales]|jgi:hypothetical protein|uniref:Uncharacterized protein n=1 Tax=Acidilutibacter cellobiosedens TaxID=2507161 RepID=A0A410Q939_9FIRM|nr:MULTISPECIES: hypothetical protein [Tissierellales]MBE6083847.1 hypothetical protein [Tissierellaceae bacterium]QAT60512.1 hypothetical protein EQM13_02445 [Acidilutibacter cellobiosedens]SCL88204.1 hypothetical protein PP176A_1469 [Sporanaerobacter sp. PP17-6a]